MRVRIHKRETAAFILLASLFVFILGIQASFLIGFMEAERRFLQGLRSLEKTATWEP